MVGAEGSTMRTKDIGELHREPGLPRCASRQCAGAPGLPSKSSGEDVLARCFCAS
jgi:hypothetical protein